MDKYCKKCKTTKPKSDFGHNKNFEDGLSQYCKICTRSYIQEWLNKNGNREKEKTRTHLNYVQNRERDLEKGRIRRLKDRDKLNEYRMSVYYKDKEFRPQRLILAAAKSRAKINKLPFDLTESDIMIPDVCPILGIPLKVNFKRNDEGSPSLDRIVPELGYVKGNVAVICHRANVIKSFGTAEEHYKIAEWMRNMEHDE